MHVSALSTGMHSHEVGYSNNNKLEQMQEVKTVFYLFSISTIKTQGNKLPAPSRGKILIQADQHTYKVFGFNPHSQTGSDS